METDEEIRTEEEVRKRVGEGIDGDTPGVWWLTAKIRDKTIYLPDTFSAEGFEKLYRKNLEKEGYGVDVDPKLGPKQGSLDMGVPRTTRNDDDNLVMRCSHYGHLENPYPSKIKPILHGGNRVIYRALDDIVDSLAEGGDCLEPIVVHGQNGLGKTYAMNYLLYMAMKRDIPSVGYSVSALSDFLNPQKNPRTGEIPVPEWYNLARNHAKLVVLDQVHGLFNVKGKKITHREGTQNWIFDLMEDVKKRGGNIVFSYTDIGKLDINGAVEVLTDEKEYSGKTRDGGDYTTLGRKDLGVRLESFLHLEIKHVPSEDYSDILRKITGGNGALIKDGMSDEQIVTSFVDANYGIKKATFRKMDSDIRKVVRLSRLSDKKITPAFIMETIGGKRAKDKFASRTDDKEGEEEMPDESSDSGGSELTMKKLVEKYRDKDNEDQFPLF